MRWHNEPPRWRVEDHVITMTTGPQTDFWRKTYDGGVRDSGHFYYQPVTGDFTAQVKVIGQYSDLYDQAGLMVRLDETTWMKCGIEFVDGVQHASVVVTRDWSDWSILPLDNPPAIWLKIVRRGPTVEVYYSLDGEAYTLIRQAFLTEKPDVSVGVMAAAPTGGGLTVTFEEFSVRGE
ncbi:MAG: DUF1349 domain-containing protein [Anaerolineae bacterium]|nr:DUF1349 domain-containing protein [Anaerolineae bacterium]